ncbi:MAG: DinB family protein [Chloroflexi bacterium]|nr:DinB family protein [Chloroflexota bacterium]
MHIAAISGGDYWYLYDEVMAGLNDEQVKTVPRPGLNSIAWLLWHITRIEDMTINFLVLEQP